MKKLLSILLATIMVLSFAGCGKDSAVGTVYKKDGGTETLTAKELWEICDTNLTKYKAQYDNRKVTVIGEVTKIGTSTIRIGENFNCWIIKDLQSYNLSNFDIGDTVIATGTIDYVFAGEVEVVEGTLKHYN